MNKLNKYIEKANLIHNNKYNYEKFNFKNVDTKSIIICPIHGGFLQDLYHHINRKQGCPACSKLRKGKKLTIEQFVKKAKLIHGNDYDYSLVNYVNYNTKVKIICKKCGNVFEQTPNNHLSKRNWGCGKCYLSKLEKETEFLLKENNINFESQKRFFECRDNKPLPFDFYIPEKNTLIECQGIQHYEYRDFFGDKKEWSKLLKHDQIKREFCNLHNFNLVEIKYNENILTKLKENSII